MKRLKVVCVDDAPQLLKLLQAALPVALNAEVRGAENAGSALTLMAEGFIPDVLLMDYMMPGRTGIQLAQYIQHNPAFAKTCVIVYSALGNNLARSALNSGVYQVLEKPMRTKDLAAAIQQSWADFAAGHPSPLEDRPSASSEFDD